MPSSGAKSMKPTGISSQNPDLIYPGQVFRIPEA